ncbi:1-acyl-sn-glycerol-3-phosphate acyltransferase [Marivirga sp. S37H4]|uniref:1-acyl-sn-glycerol-3-phosphate acyltransferase n=1 Tax=Marivirga aurantiaca TaxID=2802615 RepID=A0A934X045_9BACT|nr:1-acyl-sn-glycerol-3-phosphate acyltransferase [Marivirga aurantiaca]MBK6266433.1 1-acyl-sn-glycerol-3-phosphate acyltransferase [Marivirga aurantiaca]
MDYSEAFETIRPYHDTEVQAAIKRFISHPFFDQIAEKLFPDKSIVDLKQQLSQIQSVKEFQAVMMYPSARRVLDRSSEGISYEGFEKLEKHKSYLFISNHRDIVLDSAILNVLLFEHQLGTTEVAIGDNLLVNDWITDFAKLNKNFIVNRNVAPREMYSYSLILSAYIRYTLLEKKTSIWIAQREGRTKDGDDQTQQGLLKMIGLDGGDDFYENYAPLRIAPMAISYEYDPCDVLKAREIQYKMAGKPLQKTPGDDLKSMITGITGIKGRVHLSIGKIVDEKLREIKEIKNKNDQMQALADLIDERIHQNYKLWPTNFIAYDWLVEERFSDHYTKEEAEKFEDYLRKQVQTFSGDFKSLRDPLLAMYANPVKNKLKLDGVFESNL